MTVQVGLCQTWSETPKTGGLALQLIQFQPMYDCLCSYSLLCIQMLICPNRMIAKFSLSGLIVSSVLRVLLYHAKPLHAHLSCVKLFLEISTKTGINELWQSKLNKKFALILISTIGIRPDCPCVSVIWDNST